MIEICVYKRVRSSALDAGKVCSSTSVGLTALQLLMLLVSLLLDVL